MATIATLQILLNEQEEQQAAERLNKIKALLLQQESVVDVRVDDMGGPLLSLPDMDSRIAVTTDQYSAGQAFTSAHFEVPMGRPLQVRPLATGELKVVFPMPWDGKARSIDLHASVTTDTVTVDLRPSGLMGDLLGSRARAELSFDSAQKLLDLGKPEVLAGEDDLPFQEGRFRLYDKLTGRPLMGLALNVCALGTCAYVTVADGKAIHHGVSVFETFEDRYVHMEGLDPDSNTAQPLYFTDEGEVVSLSRVKLIAA